MSKRAIIWTAVSSQAQAADDKISLNDQHASCVRWCYANGYTVIKTLTVDGYSRSESDVVTALQEFAQQGVTAYHDLRTHWQQRDFDALVAYSGSRFGRSSTLMTYVVENTIRAGAVVHTVSDGKTLNDDNYLFGMAMDAVSAPAEISRLQRQKRVAYDKYARAGIPIAPFAPMSHRIIRDDKGVRLRYELDPQHTQLWLDLADVLLDGTPTSRLEHNLFERYGYGTGGHAYHPKKFYRLLHNPIFWGHSARHHTGAGIGMYLIEAGHTIPDGVIMQYDTHEPVYTGAIAKQVKSELARRATVVRGKARPNNTYMFSGLVICARCGYRMNRTTNVQQWSSMVCVSRYHATHARATCDNIANVPHQHIQTWIHAFIMDVLQAGDFNAGFPDRVHELASRIERINSEIIQTETVIGRLIMDKARASADIRSIYDAKITEEQTRLYRLKSSLNTLRTQQGSVAQDRREAAFERLRVDFGETFWDRSSVEINRLLRAFFGEYRLAANDGEIVGLAQV